MDQKGCLMMEKDHYWLLMRKLTIFIIQIFTNIDMDQIQILQMDLFYIME
jgi:hypothetical protein